MRVDLDLDAHPGKLAVQLFEERGGLVRRDVGRMLVELVEHPAHRPLEQRRRLDRLEVLAFDGGHGLAHHAGETALLGLLVADQRHQRQDDQGEQRTAWHGELPQRAVQAAIVPAGNLSPS